MLVYDTESTYQIPKKRFQDVFIQQLSDEIFESTAQKNTQNPHSETNKTLRKATNTNAKTSTS